jgi:hypothetical protein
VLALEADRIGRPRRAHQLDVVLGHRPALVERRRVQRLELFAQPAHACAQDHAALREHVDRREHLRGEQRVAVRNHQHADAELRPLGRVREVAQGRERLEIVLREPAGELPAGGVWIHRLGRRGRHHDVIRHEQRVEPEHVRFLGELEDDVDAGQRPATRQ